MGGLKLTLETLGRLGIVGLAEQGVAMTPEPDYAAFTPDSPNRTVCIRVS
jgi:hypothetical protein